jgi:hypothetical protein
MEQPEKRSSSGAFVLFAILHLACCGLPLLLLSGLSFKFLHPNCQCWALY